MDEEDIINSLKLSIKACKRIDVDKYDVALARYIEGRIDAYENCIKLILLGRF